MPRFYGAETSCGKKSSSSAYYRRSGGGHNNNDNKKKKVVIQKRAYDGHDDDPGSGLQRERFGTLSLSTQNEALRGKEWDASLGGYTINGNNEQNNSSALLSSKSSSITLSPDLVATPSTTIALKTESKETEKNIIISDNSNPANGGDKDTDLVVSVSPSSVITSTNNIGSNIIARGVADGTTSNAKISNFGPSGNNGRQRRRRKKKPETTDHTINTSISIVAINTSKKVTPPKKEEEEQEKLCTNTNQLDVPYVSAIAATPDANNNNNSTKIQNLDNLNSHERSSSPVMQQQKQQKAKFLPRDKRLPASASSAVPDNKSSSFPSKSTFIPTKQQQQDVINNALPVKIACSEVADINITTALSKQKQEQQQQKTILKKIYGLSTTSSAITTLQQQQHLKRGSALADGCCLSSKKTWINNNNTNKHNLSIIAKNKGTLLLTPHDDKQEEQKERQQVILPPPFARCSNHEAMTVTKSKHIILSNNSFGNRSIVNEETIICTSTPNNVTISTTTNSATPSKKKNSLISEQKKTYHTPPLKQDSRLKERSHNQKLQIRQSMDDNNAVLYCRNNDVPCRNPIHGNDDGSSSAHSSIRATTSTLDNHMNRHCQITTESVTVTSTTQNEAAAAPSPHTSSVFLSSPPPLRSINPNIFSEKIAIGAASTIESTTTRRRRKRERSPSNNDQPQQQSQEPPRAVVVTKLTKTPLANALPCIEIQDEWDVQSIIAMAPCCIVSSNPILNLVAAPQQQQQHENNNNAAVTNLFLMGNIQLQHLKHEAERLIQMHNNTQQACSSLSNIVVKPVGFYYGYNMAALGLQKTCTTQYNSNEDSISRTKSTNDGNVMLLTIANVFEAHKISSNDPIPEFVCAFLALQLCHYISKLHSSRSSNDDDGDKECGGGDGYHGDLGLNSMVVNYGLFQFSIPTSSDDKEDTCTKAASNIERKRRHDWYRVAQIIHVLLSGGDLIPFDHHPAIDDENGSSLNISGYLRGKQRWLRLFQVLLHGPPPSPPPSSSSDATVDSVDTKPIQHDINNHKSWKHELEKVLTKLLSIVYMKEPPEYSSSVTAAHTSTSGNQHKNDNDLNYKKYKNEKKEKNKKEKQETTALLLERKAANTITDMMNRPMPARINEYFKHIWGFREHLTTATTPQPTTDLEIQKSYKRRRMIADIGSSSNSSDNCNGLEYEHHKDEMKRLNSGIRNSFALHFHPLTTTTIATKKIADISKQKGHHGSINIIKPLHAAINIAAVAIQSEEEKESIIDTITNTNTSKSSHITDNNNKKYWKKKECLYRNEITDMQKQWCREQVTMRSIISDAMQDQENVLEDRLHHYQRTLLQDAIKELNAREAKLVKGEERLRDEQEQLQLATTTSSRKNERKNDQKRILEMTGKLAKKEASLRERETVLLTKEIEFRERIAHWIVNEKRNQPAAISAKTNNTSDILARQQNQHSRHHLPSQLQDSHGQQKVINKRSESSSKFDESSNASDITNNTKPLNVVASLQIKPEIKKKARDKKKLCSSNISPSLSSSEHGDATACFPSLSPKTKSNEYEVCIPITSMGLMIHLKSLYGSIVFAGHRRLPASNNNTIAGSVERNGLIRSIGDKVVAIDGVPTVTLTIGQVTNLIRTKLRNNFILFRFLDVNKVPSSKYATAASTSNSDRKPMKRNTTSQKQKVCGTIHCRKDLLSPVHSKSASKPTTVNNTVRSNGLNQDQESNSHQNRKTIGNIPMKFEKQHHPHNIVVIDCTSDSDG